MKTFPMFLSAGLLCAGLVVGCAETEAPTAGTDAEGDTSTAWVEDVSVTKANLKVTGMT
ncbi:hypothetical protein OT109_05995 [Phycisphaeraceae bacterium D3-23]